LKCTPEARPPTNANGSQTVSHSVQQSATPELRDYAFLNDFDQTIENAVLSPIHAVVVHVCVVVTKRQ